MELIEVLTKVALLLSNDYLLMLIAVLFFIFSKRQNHSHLILLLLFAMIYKTILKDVFKWSAPVTSPTSNFAFPSGHMNFAAVFYLWFMITYRLKTLYTLCPLSLFLTGWAMVYAGYHHPLDIILTPIFPIILLIIYKLLLGKLSFNKFALTFVAIALVSQLVSILLIGTLKCDVIIGTYGILGFVFGAFIKTKKYHLLLVPAMIMIAFALITQDFNAFIGNCLWFVVFGMISGIKGKSRYEI